MESNHDYYYEHVEFLSEKEITELKEQCAHQGWQYSESLSGLILSVIHDILRRAQLGSSLGIPRIITFHRPKR